MKLVCCSKTTMELSAPPFGSFCMSTSNTSSCFHFCNISISSLGVMRSSESGIFTSVLVLTGFLFSVLSSLLVCVALQHANQTRMTLGENQPGNRLFVVHLRVRPSMKSSSSTSVDRLLFSNLGKYKLGAQCPGSLPPPRPDIAHFSVRTVSTCPQDWDVDKGGYRLAVRRPLRWTLTEWWCKPITTSPLLSFCEQK